MAQQQQQQVTPSAAWSVELLPLVVVLLIVFHVFALVYWIYRLATEKQSQRTKRH